MPTRPTAGHKGIPARSSGQYRIRWSIVSHGNGHQISRERMCIAERKRRWFGWWPMLHAEWRFEEAEAERDIERDKELRAPLPAPRVVT